MKTIDDLLKHFDKIEKKVEEEIIESTEPEETISLLEEEEKMKEEDSEYFLECDLVDSAGTIDISSLTDDTIQRDIKFETELGTISINELFTKITNLKEEVDCLKGLVLSLTRKLKT